MLQAFEEALGPQAAEKLASLPPAVAPSNPALSARIGEIMERPEFKEVMDRILHGKTAAEIRAAREEDTPENRQTRYHLAMQSIRYEKRCARIATEALWKEKGVGSLAEDKIINAENALLANKQFRAVCAEALKGKKPDEVEAMTAELDKPDIQKKTAESILGSVTGSRQNPEEGVQQLQPERAGEEAGIGLNP